MIIIVFLFTISLITSNEAIRDEKVKCLENERQALLSFKHGLLDENGVLSSWKYQNGSDCCKWRGVECSNLTNHVIKLDLHGTDELQLSGKIGPSLQELSYLNYLDLSSNGLSDNGPIPKHIGSLVNLKHLNLSSNGFAGSIPSNLGNLSNLIVLDISSNDLPAQKASSLNWLSNLYLLRHIDLSSIDLSQVRNWPQIVSNLPHLEVLKLSSCNLSQPIIQFRLDSNFSAPLQVLDLSYNCFESSIFPWLFNFSTTLVQLDLSNICLQGYMINGLSNMTSLTHINFQDNFLLEGVSPKFFENLCNLRSLSFVRNNLQGSFSNFLQILPKCTLNSLHFLRLSSNNLFGTLPDFTLLPNLKGLDLSVNELNGTVPSSLGQLVHLEFLNLAQNSLQGLISEAHFLKLTKLKDLVLGENSFFFDLPLNWDPPFQLDSILLKSCKLGRRFPNWLRTQNFSHLDISNTSISDMVPHWFWNNMPPRLQFLDLSKNNMSGQIPTTSVRFTGEPAITLRSNEFDGQVPSFISQAREADVSRNKFSSVTFLCTLTTISPIYSLDISKNHITGDLPNCWENMSNLIFLSLSNNDIYGNIPNSLSNLPQLESLHLRKNYFSGELPSWLKNTPSVMVVDLGFNNLSGPIPSWIGENFPYLSLISLRSNHFHGDLPLSLCNLKAMYFLDFAMNNITGHIPNCLHNLIALTGEFHFMLPLRFSPSIDYSLDMSQILRPVGLQLGGSNENIDDMVVSWKGREVNMNKDLIRSIDLSDNHLSGEIPSVVTNLTELVSLNLSTNNLSGEIPKRIGQLKLLDVLDLSRNQLVGHIPDSISEINRLSVLDLSYNNLSGKIPTGTQLQTFPVYRFKGNYGLCGSPLPKCNWEITNDFPHPQDENNKEEEIISREFYLSMILGYIVSFWVIFGTLAYHRRWRHAYFKLMSDVTDWVFVKIVIYTNKIQRFLEHNNVIRNVRD